MIAVLAASPPATEMAKKPYIIALEEHYLDPEVKQLGGGPGAGSDIVKRLDDLGALRIREMDEAGIDLQVLSHSIPGLQAVDAEAGPPLARRTNDRLDEAVLRRPCRRDTRCAIDQAAPQGAPVPRDTRQQRMRSFCSVACSGALVEYLSPASANFKGQRDIGLSGVQLETNCAGLADHAAEREAIRLLAREVKSAFR